MFKQSFFLTFLGMTVLSEPLIAMEDNSKTFRSLRQPSAVHGAPMPIASSANGEGGYPMHRQPASYGASLTQPNGSFMQSPSSIAPQSGSISIADDNDAAAEGDISLASTLCSLSASPAKTASGRDTPVSPLMVETTQNGSIHTPRPIACNDSESTVPQQHSATNSPSIQTISSPQSGPRFIYREKTPPASIYNARRFMSAIVPATFAGHHIPHTGSAIRPAPFHQTASAIIAVPPVSPGAPTRATSRSRSRAGHRTISHVYNGVPVHHQPCFHTGYENPYYMDSLIAPVQTHYGYLHGPVYSYASHMHSFAYRAYPETFHRNGFYLY